LDRIKDIKMKSLYILFLLFIFQNNLLRAQRLEAINAKANKLYSKGHFKKAIRVAEFGLEYSYSKFGILSNEYAGFLNDLGVLHNQSKENKKAEEYYIRALDIKKILFGENNPEVASLITNLAIFYDNLYDYNRAEPLYFKALEIRRNVLGEENPEYFNSLKNLADFYFGREMYEKAESLYIQVLERSKCILGDKSLEFATSLNDLARFYHQIENYDKAEPLYIQAIEIRGNTLGKETLDYATLLLGLANLYSDMDNYDQSEVMLNEAIPIFKKLDGEEGSDYVHSLLSLAILNEKKGNFSQAEFLCAKVNEIRKKLFGIDSPEYASSLNILGRIYAEKGDYAKAEPIWQRVLIIRNKTIGQNHSDYATSLNNLATLYVELGNYEKAESYFNLAFEIYKNVYSDSSLSIVPALNNLAGLFRQTANYSKAEPLLIKALEINRINLGEDNIDFLIAQNNLGLLYSEMGEYSKAEVLYIQVLKFSKKLYGNHNQAYISSLHNLAGLYSDIGEYERADSLYSQALNIRKIISGDESLDYGNTLINSAYNLEKKNDIDNASLQYSNAINIFKNIWRTNLSYLSSSEAENFLKSQESNFEIPLSFLSRYPYVTLKEELSDFNLFIKNILFVKNSVLENAISSNSDSSIRFISKNYKNICRLISEKLQFDATEKKELSQLYDKVDSLEKELMLKLPQYVNVINSNKVTWKNIKSKLKGNEAILDFVYFRYYDGRWTDTFKISVFVLRPEWDKPRFINLFNEDQLASLFNTSNTSNSINNLYNGNKSLNDSNSTLYNLIWQPIDSLLKGVKKVYISPSGMLNQVSFSAIPIPEGGRLIDRYSIEQLSNIRAIVVKSLTQEDSIKSITLFGGADFNVEPAFSERLNVNYIPTETFFSEIRSLHGGKWSYLSGTENEVNTIKNIANPNELSINLLTGSHASEEAFKSFGYTTSTVPSVIHIATHGFAFPTPQKISKEQKLLLKEDRASVFSTSEDPLTRAGLIMAGGNHVWTTGVPYPNHDDGILTAREISQLNLNDCVLATLSACETGLGEIKGNEGVFGLQRAFKMAGVKYLIVSLWKVPDFQTTEFMQLFYSSWLITKLPIRDAFRQTQITMSKKYSPYYWGAFILIE